MTDIGRITKIKHLAEMEASAVNIAFGVGTEEGNFLIKNAVSSFSEHLKGTKINFIPAMDVEYRVFVVELLSKIEERYKSDSVKSLLFPNI